MRSCQGPPAMTSAIAAAPHISQRTLADPSTPWCVPSLQVPLVPSLVDLGWLRSLARSFPRSRLISRSLLPIPPTTSPPHHTIPYHTISHSLSVVVQPPIQPDLQDTLGVFAFSAVCTERDYPVLRPAPSYTGHTHFPATPCLHHHDTTRHGRGRHTYEPTPC